MLLDAAYGLCVEPRRWKREDGKGEVHDVEWKLPRTSAIELGAWSSLTARSSNHARDTLLDRRETFLYNAGERTNPAAWVLFLPLVRKKKVSPNSDLGIKTSTPLYHSYQRLYDET